MNITINEDNLQINDIKETKQKVRALLINNNKELLIANYGGVYLLPGGSIDTNETIINALIRELTEETGYKYNENDLEYLCTLDYYQKNYPKRNCISKNRLVKTHYFIGATGAISRENQTLTENEKKSNFKLEFIPLDQLENLIINNQNNNPRNIYFQKELLTVLEFYKQYTKNNHKIKLKV